MNFFGCYKIPQRFQGDNQNKNEDGLKTGDLLPEDKALSCRLSPSPAFSGCLCALASNCLG